MIANKYRIHSWIGTGGSANVFLVFDAEGNKYAAKVMRGDKKYTNEVLLGMMMKEYYAMQTLSLHPNILKMSDLFINEEIIFPCKQTKISNSISNTDNKVWSTETINWLILEYAEKESIGKFLRKNGGFSEFISWFLFNQIVSAVKYMHENNISHCDIKPQNILLDSCYNAKIADFGTAEAISEGARFISNRKGTRRYMAPELFPFDSKEPYDPKKADIYALGVTLFSIITGELDLEIHLSENFTTLDSDKLNKSAANSEILNDKKLWNIEEFGLSEEVISLIKWMLMHDPDQRPTIEEVTNHFWLVEGCKYITPSQVYSDLINLN